MGEDYPARLPVSKGILDETHLLKRFQLLRLIKKITENPLTSG